MGRGGMTPEERDAISRQHPMWPVFEAYYAGRRRVHDSHALTAGATVSGMALPTDPRDDQAHIPQQAAAAALVTEQATPAPKRRKAWPWILAAVVAVLAAGGGTAYALAAGGKDPGVVACENAAERAAAGRTADTSDDGDVQLLKDSQHADLREVGEAIDRAAASGDLADAMKVGVQMMAACARHDVVIDPT